MEDQEFVKQVKTVDDVAINMSPVDNSVYIVGSIAGDHIHLIDEVSYGMMVDNNQDSIDMATNAVKNMCVDAYNGA